MTTNCEHSESDHAVVNRTIGQIALWMEALAVPEILKEVDLPPIWMDSRKITKGDLFLALVGEERDGHDFVATALSQGACGAIIAASEVHRFTPEILALCIVVENPLTAVQKAAYAYRVALAMPIIAVTGSNGKTTTSHFLKEILSTDFQVGGTVGNWNNHIGVPLSILRLSGEEEVAVFEVGANHVGEIEELAAIIEPDMAIITNVGYAHVGLFGSIEQTAAAKFELARQVAKVDGLLFLNGDDEMSIKQNENEQIPALYFGLSEECEIRAEEVVCREDGCYSFEFDGMSINLATPGLHVVYGVLPAIVIALQMGIPWEKIIAKIESLRPVALRGVVEELHGVRYIMDCYNANPSSMKVANKLLVDMPHATRRIAVLGDMRELGSYTDALHKEIGQFYAASAIDMLVAVGEYAPLVIEGALAQGFSPEKCFALSDIEGAVSTLRSLVKTGDLVLLKGSRGIALEQILDGLRGAQ